MTKEEKRIVKETQRDYDRSIKKYSSKNVELIALGILLVLFSVWYVFIK